MTSTLEPDLKHIEEHASGALSEEALHAPIVDPADPAEDEAPFASGRTAAAVSATVIAAAVMVGGVFAGISPRALTIVAGLLGVGLGVVADRIKKPVTANLAIVGGLFAIGLVALLLKSPGDLGRIGSAVREASRNGDVLRPPVPFSAGWAAIAGWLVGIVGFGATWVALAFRKPALGLLVPLPVLGVAAISVPKGQQLGSGLAALVLFAIGLGLLSSAQRAGEVDQKVPIGYEVRRVLRSLPLVGVVTAALWFAAQSNLLFPPPIYDPTNQPQEPKALPLSAADDRVLFKVSEAGDFKGPFRTGSLDFFEPSTGRFLLPPFAESRLASVPESGVVDEQLIERQGTAATIEVQGLSGAVLPGVPNTVAIKALGPPLAYDPRTATIRVDQGSIAPGLRYVVAGASLPTAAELAGNTRAISADATKFLDTFAPPPAAQALIEQAQTLPSLFERMNTLRLTVLEQVTVAGQGKPVPVTPERVQDMLAGSREGTPFEIVALEVLFARWVGVPSRIGYGFDSDATEGAPCAFKDGALEVRPRCSATFPEFYFEGFGWIPINKAPTNQKPSLGRDQVSRANEAQAAEEISVQLYLPVVEPVGGVLAQQLLRSTLAAAALLALALLGYALFPLLSKARARARRRAWAEQQGLRARLALAYADWRDAATDFGYRHDGDTPLMFVDRVAEDDEHLQLAWLTTRGLYGDLRDELSEADVVAAEELSRALRRRLASAHPATVRAIAALSRLSVRHPYAPGLEPPARTHPSRKERRRAPAPNPA